MSNKTKVLFVAYIFAVLFFAGTARAEINPTELAVTYAKMQAPVQISQVNLDPQALQLFITGNLPNPCFSEPYAQLTPDLDNPNTLIIRLSSPIPTSMCVARVKPYRTVVSLPALAQAAQIRLHDKGTYLLKTEGYPFEMMINASDLLP